MKFLLSSCVALAIVLCGCGKKSDSTLTVATDNTFVPFEFLDTETGETVGFDIDLIRAIAEEAGLELEIQSMEFDGIIAGLQANRYDLAIAGMTITDERKKSVDFSAPYYDSGLTIAVQKDNTTITSIADLAGKRVGTRSGTTGATYLQENVPTAEVVAFPGIVEAYMDLQAGRIDAVLYDQPNISYYITKEGGTELKMVGGLLRGEQYGIAFPKGSPHKAKVDAALQTLRDNGTYDRIYAKWFGAGTKH